MKDNLKFLSLLEEVAKNDYEEEPVCFASIGDRDDVGHLTESFELHHHTYYHVHRENPSSSSYLPLLGHRDEKEDAHMELAKHYNPLNGTTNLKSEANWPHTIAKSFKPSMPSANQRLHHREGIYDYTEDSKVINNYLWDKHQREIVRGVHPSQRGKLNAEDHEYFERPNGSNSSINIRAIDHLTRQHQTSPRNLTLYAGTRRNIGAMMTDSGRVHFPAFTSASLSYDIATKFAKKSANQMQRDPQDALHQHVLKIHWPRGSNGAYIAHHSEHTGEREFLIPRGVTLKIDKTPQTYQHDDRAEGGDLITHHIWTATPVRGHKLITEANR